MTVLCLILAGVPAQGVRELLIPVSPLEALYGDALVASQGADAFLANPSLAARLSYPYLEVAHTEWFMGSRRERVEFLMPQTWGTIGIGVNGFHVWDLEARPHPDSAPRDFSAYNTGFEVRYARNIESFTLGASLEAFLEHIYTYSAWGVKGSLGASYNIRPFSIGISILNLGPRIKLLNEPTSLPTRAQLGGSWKPSGELELAIGCSYAPDSTGGSFDASLGISGTLFKILRLDAGAGYGAHPHVGAGINITIKEINLSYGASLRPGIGFSHHIGVGVLLPPRQREDPNLRLAMETSKTFTEVGKRDMLNRDYLHALDQFDIALTWWPDNEEAQEGYNEALAKERELQISLHLEAARQHVEKQGYLDASREYEFVLSLAPDNALAISGNAEMLLKVQEMPILAKGDIPLEATRLFEAGVDWFRKDDFKQARAFWREIESRYPYIEEIKPFVQLASDRLDEQIDSLMHSAYAARERDALSQATALVGKVLQIDPTNGRAYALREELTTLTHRRVSEFLEEALGYYDSRRYQLAAQTFNKILAIDPANATAKRYLARIEQEERLTQKDLAALNITATNAYTLGDYDTAIRIWEQIITIDSTFANVQRNLSRAKQKKALLGTP